MIVPYRLIFQPYPDPDHLFVLTVRGAIGHVANWVNRSTQRTAHPFSGGGEGASFGVMFEPTFAQREVCAYEATDLRKVHR